MSKTVHISSTAQFTELLKSSRIVVTDFYADWCGPCKTIAPVYETLSAQLSRPNQITFTKVNTEEQQELAAKYSVRALPTFMIFNQGQPVEKVQGADVRKLQDVVRKLATEAEGGKGFAAASGSGSGSSWRATPVPKGYTDVTDQIEIKGLDMLNSDTTLGGVRTLFEDTKPSALDAKGKADSNKKDYVESDTDQQLMLFMPFQATLKVHTLQITSLPPPVEDDDDDEAPRRPRTINIYSNRAQILGFEEAEDIPVTQTVTLSEKDWDASGTATIPLRYVKFQNVTSLVVFFVDVEGDGEKLRLDRVRVIGEKGDKRELGKLEKIGDEPGE